MLAITILLRIEFNSGWRAKMLQESASFPTLKCRWGMCVWVFQLFLLAFKSTFTKVRLCQRFSIDARFLKFCSSVRKLCQPIASILVLSNESGKPRMNLFIHSFQYKMSVIRHFCRCRLFSLLSGRKFIISCKNYKLKLFTFYCYWHPRAICLRTNGWNFSAFLEGMNGPINMQWRYDIIKYQMKLFFATLCSKESEWPSTHTHTHHKCADRQFDGCRQLHIQAQIYIGNMKSW